MVRLAVLSDQCPMHDTDKWNEHVASLMDNYKELDIDPLAQACFAYLSLTTSDPQATMTRNLPASLSQADFDKTVRIPELLSKLDGQSQNVAQQTLDNSIAVVIARREHQDVIFAKFVDGWSFSMEPIDVSIPEDHETRLRYRTLIWGDRPEQTANVTIASSLWRYIVRHHAALMARVRQDHAALTKASLASMLAHVRRPFDLR